VQTKDQGVGIGRFDAFDHLIETLAGTHHMFGRKNDFIPGRLGIGRGEVGAIVELHPLAQLEGVGQAILTPRPRFS
jgi:hypothetical protein